MANRALRARGQGLYHVALIVNIALTILGYPNLKAIRFCGLCPGTSALAAPSYESRTRNFLPACSGLYLGSLFSQ